MPVGFEAHSVLATAAAYHGGIRGCFYNNGWNNILGRLEHMPIDWGQLYSSLEMLQLRHAAAVRESDIAQVPLKENVCKRDL